MDNSWETPRIRAVGQSARRAGSRVSRFGRLAQHHRNGMKSMLIEANRLRATQPFLALALVGLAAAATACGPSVGSGPSASDASNADGSAVPEVAEGGSPSLAADASAGQEGNGADADSASVPEASVGSKPEASTIPEGGDPQSDGDAGRSGSEAGSSASTTRLVAYLPDWNGSFANYAKSVTFSKMTHVNIAFLNPPSCGGTCTANSNMTFSMGQSDADIATFVKAAHSAGVKVLASIGGGGGDQRILQFYNANLSDALVASLDGYLKAHDLDGADVDIESIPNFGAPYGTFVSALVKTLRPQGKLVTAAVAQYLQGGMPDSALHEFDFINDMIYSTNLSGVTNELDYYVRQKNVPKNQITLGVGFFGQQGNNEIEYNKILTQYPNAWQSDSVNGIRYTGEATMAKETLLGKQYGGIMIWELTGDAPAPHSLLNVVESNL
jgi:chitinase